MELSLDINKYFSHKVEYKNKRDELIKKAVLHINLLRKGTIFENRIETPAKLAKRINQNPFLAGKEKDGELENVLKECERKNNYSYLYLLLKNK
jgi:hypothetical protein